MKNPIKARIRTVNVNNRGQIVIPEDIRTDWGIKDHDTLVLIERNRELVLRRESEVVESIENG